MCRRSDDESGGEEDDAGQKMVRESFDDYEAGGYSPVYVDISTLEPGTLVVNEEEDAQRLHYARLHLSSHDTQVSSRIPHCLLLE